MIKFNEEELSNWNSSPKVLAGTGHRPEKLGREYDLKGRISDYLRQELKHCFEILGPRKIISGMAQGFDQLLVLVAIEQGLKVVAAVPCDNQEAIWPTKSQKLYQSILENPLVTLKVVCPGPYHISKMQDRNIWMSNNCDALVTCWDGSSGGTANCISYAKSIKKPLWSLDLLMIS